VMSKSKDSCNVRKNKANVIIGVATNRPQCNVSFLKDRRKKLDPLESVPHRNPDDVILWQHTDRHLTPFEFYVKQSREAPSFISCVDKFDSTMSEIQNKACLGFDLEGHMQFFFGMTVKHDGEVHHLYLPRSTRCSTWMHQETRCSTSNSFEFPPGQRSSTIYANGRVILRENAAAPVAYKIAYGCAQHTCVACNRRLSNFICNRIRLYEV
ncbi:unnamed protein product, partial [Allacma fusca]